MAYIEEASSWRLRRRHRQQITLAVVLLLLLGAGGIGYAIYSGAIGGPAPVNVATLPPCQPTVAPPRPDQVIVNVYNATSRNGLAAKTASTLSLREFSVKAIANDPRTEKVTGVAIIRFGPKGASGAQVLARHVKGAKLVNDKRKSATVDLILGNGYKSLQPLASTQPTPVPTPTCRPVTATPTTTGTATGSAKPSGPPAKSRPTTTAK